jgi:hypothetical protein
MKGECHVGVAGQDIAGADVVTTVGFQNAERDLVFLSSVGVRLLPQLGAVLEMELGVCVLVLGWVDGQVRISSCGIRNLVVDIPLPKGCHLIEFVLVERLATGCMAVFLV